MIKEQRFQIILNELAQKEQVTYGDLAEVLKVSEDTVRRDIDSLYQNGLVSKVRRGAMLPSPAPVSFQDRALFLQEEKNIIATKTLSFIKPGMTLFMDGGSTMCVIANRLPSDIAVRIITHNIPAIQLLTQHKNVEVIVLGGKYDTETATCTGITTCLEVRNYVADLYLMGICAISDKFGVTATFQDDADVKRAMLSRSRQTFAIANSAVLQQNESFHVCEMKELEAIVTDLESNHPALDPFRNQGSRII
ncbi:DeoR/GlpR family DNA-binding transcription regulator [Chitinophaga agri]|uniref:DeoR/GlpR transcriptional regulator n=1 Tax=Chitinophaga agri TaxID=2703787 RepID=A0A6B9ZA66_9BACT|nr:DeoR/GlpR family DNA-binding transcription regulator [Chitinophaga agri]QHS59232.1 DeoR/GlpR transcriptional regulator [Chitinophaga agri]